MNNEKKLNMILFYDNNSNEEISNSRNDYHVLTENQQMQTNEWISIPFNITKKFTKKTQVYNNA